MCLCYFLFFTCWAIFHKFLSSAEIFHLYLFQNILSGITSKCHIAWTQIRPDRTLGLIWVLTVCKDHQQATKFAASMNIHWHMNSVCSILSTIKVILGCNGAGVQHLQDDWFNSTHFFTTHSDCKYMVTNGVLQVERIKIVGE